jgi:CDP-glycerol glycerophosphotransferase (TagB/SpsB family)
MVVSLTFKRQLRKSLEPLEKVILSDHYFSLQDYLTYVDKLELIKKDLIFRLFSKPQEDHLEVIFLLYSKACERMLTPLALSLLQRPEVSEKKLKITLIILKGIHQLQLNQLIIEQLSAAGCNVETDYFSLIRACTQPNNKLVAMCLDHRLFYQFHKCGVDTADKLTGSGVKTISIQHGGTRRDSMEGLATTASNTIMVWGKRVQRELISKYGVDQSRVRLIGNPLHDRLVTLDQEAILSKLMNLYSQVRTQLPQKKIVLLATCLHSEYKGYENEQQLYRNYIRHVYESIDFSQVILLIKMHPLDSKEPNLYREEISESHDSASIIIMEPDFAEFNIYELLLISDLLLTRCSTVAEEALVLGKQVIAFDLFESGLSQGYKHLEEYGSYTTVYATPHESLGELLSNVLFSSSGKQTSDHQALSNINVEEELTYALDGNSTHRAVDEILEQLFSQSDSHSKTETTLSVL